MNEEILQSVLTESMEEQRYTTVNVGLLTKAVEDISEKIATIENKVAALKITVPEPGLKQVKELLKEHYQLLQVLIGAQPKEVRQIKQTVLFPIESHKLEFYKAVLGQFFKWTTILVIALVIIFKIDTWMHGT